jgi:hypothetical protein
MVHLVIKLHQPDVLGLFQLLVADRRVLDFFQLVENRRFTLRGIHALLGLRREDGQRRIECGLLR